MFTNAEIAEARKALSPPSEIGLNYFRPLSNLTGANIKTPSHID